MNQTLYTWLFVGTLLAVFFSSVVQLGVYLPILIRLVFGS
jgi:hypothetical protein